MAEVIHKLNITAEAAFDICDCFAVRLDRRVLKVEVEEYITNLSASGRLPCWGYFRADYIDEDGRACKLFVYKGTRIGLMQYWELRGICAAEDWMQEAEDNGLICAWLETRIAELPEADDWAVRVRVNEILRRTEKTVWENVLEEVMNDFENERDKEAAARVAFLQSVYFDFRGRRRVEKEARRDRTGGRRVGRHKPKDN